MMSRDAVGTSVSSRGGGGAIDPLSGLAVLGLAGAAWASRRRNSSGARSV
jgi:hypothetical protein